MQAVLAADTVEDSSAVTVHFMEEAAEAAMDALAPVHAPAPGEAALDAPKEGIRSCIG